MSGVQLKPLDGVDQPISVSLGKTTIGRGPYLRVPDKKVSRQHACLEIQEGGKLKLTPIHTNPCYFRKNGKVEAQETLPINVDIELEEGDVFGLLPDQYFFKVIYTAIEKKEADSTTKTTENGHVKEKKDAEETASNSDKSDVTIPHADAKHIDKKDEKNIKGKAESNNKVVKNAENKDVALPLEKKRKLPDWMENAGSPAKKGKAGSKPSPKKPEKKDNVSDDNFDDDFEDEDDEVMPQKKDRKAPTPRRQEHNSSDDEDEMVPKQRGRGRGRPPKGSAKKKVVNDDDDDNSDEESAPKKSKKLHGRGRPKKASSEEEEEDDDSPARRLPGRTASQNQPKYGDEYVSEDNGISATDEENVGSPRKSKDDEDSDFVMEEDSASDWEKPKKPAKKPKPKADKGRRGRPAKSKAISTPSRKPPGRAVKGKKRYSDSELEDEDFDDYIPRPSKRRAAAKAAEAAKKQQKDDSDESEDANESTRVPCQHGKKCHRKNPAHIKEYSHPGDSDYECNDKNDDEDVDEVDEEEEDVNKSNKKPVRGATLSKREAVAEDASDEDEEEEEEEEEEDINDSKAAESSETETKKKVAAT